MGEMVNFSTPSDTSVTGYLARASDDAAPGIIVLQEWWGLNDQIKSTADRFASAGFTALAPDLYAGRVTEDADEAGHMMNGLDWVGATEQDICGAARYLKQSVRRVGVVGFCMGGALTVIASAKLAEIDAAVCFYGIPPREQADPAVIGLPFQAHFANQDDWCTPAAVDEFEQTLQSGGVHHELYRYDAQHGFFNNQRAEVYDAAAATLSWRRTIEFFNANL